MIAEERSLCAQEPRSQSLGAPNPTSVFLGTQGDTSQLRPLGPLGPPKRKRGRPRKDQSQAEECTPQAPQAAPDCTGQIPCPLEEPGRVQQADPESKTPDLPPGKLRRTVGRPAGKTQHEVWGAVTSILSTRKEAESVATRKKVTFLLAETDRSRDIQDVGSTGAGPSIQTKDTPSTSTPSTRPVERKDWTLEEFDQLVCSAGWKSTDCERALSDIRDSMRLTNKAEASIWQVLPLGWTRSGSRISQPCQTVLLRTSPEWFSGVKFQVSRGTSGISTLGVASALCRGRGRSVPTVLSNAEFRSPLSPDLERISEFVLPYLSNSTLSLVNSRWAKFASERASKGMDLGQIALLPARCLIPSLEEQSIGETDRSASLLSLMESNIHPSTGYQLLVQNRHLKETSGTVRDWARTLVETGESHLVSGGAFLMRTGSYPSLEGGRSSVRTGSHHTARSHVRDSPPETAVGGPSSAKSRLTPRAYSTDHPGLSRSQMLVLGMNGGISGPRWMDPSFREGPVCLLPGGSSEADNEEARRIHSIGVGPFSERMKSSIRNVREKYLWNAPIGWFPSPPPRTEKEVAKGTMGDRWAKKVVSFIDVEEKRREAAIRRAEKQRKEEERKQRKEERKQRKEEKKRESLAYREARFKAMREAKLHRLLMKKAEKLAKRKS